MSLRGYPIETMSFLNPTERKARDRSRKRGPALKTNQQSDTFWKTLAACRGKPTSWFYPTQHVDPRAYNLCHGCPVQTPCNEAGKTERYGIWAGTDRTPRRQAHGPKVREAL